MVPNSTPKPKKRTTRKKPQPAPAPMPQPAPVVVTQQGNPTLTYVLLAVLALGGFLAMKQGTTPAPAPAPAPVVAPVTPVGTLSINALPALTAKLQGNKAKAQALAALFKDWAQTIGVTGSTVTTKQALRAVNTSLITMYVKATNVPAQPAVGAEIDACLKEVLGDDPGPLDVPKAQAAFNTLALALEQVQ